eukprot:7479104-Lingulodinium_polyedra.AAC.1
MTDLEFQEKTAKQWEAEAKRIALQLSFAQIDQLKEQAKKFEPPQDMNRKGLIAFLSRMQVA